MPDGNAKQQNQRTSWRAGRDSNYRYGSQEFALPLGLPDWIGAHFDALSAIGGVPKAIVCFLAGELALRSRTRLFGERPFEIALHEAPLGAIDGRASQ